MAPNPAVRRRWSLCQAESVTSIGMRRVLLTCEQTNEASRKVIEANSGQPDGIADGELRYWISTSADR